MGLERVIIKQVVKLNKPIYIRMAILDLSKLDMYEYRSRELSFILN